MFKKSLIAFSVVAVLANSAVAANKIRVSDEASLRSAIETANTDSSIETIVFAKKTLIALSAPLIYSGVQPLTLIGNGAVIDGSSAGGFILDDDLTAKTEDGTLVFNTAAPLNIRNLSVLNSATRGIVVNIPQGASGADMSVTLKQVTVANSALYGLHIDDNADAFDEGQSGSAVGVELHVLLSSFTENGTGAIDFDGVRVDERGPGDITAFFYRTHIDANGGDGMELDEAGEGDVVANLFRVTLNDNGYYNAADLDDGFDIDEADEGHVKLTLNDVKISGNLDEGLDVDEAGEGDVDLWVRKVKALDNADEGIKVDEEDAGDINADIVRLAVKRSGDDGIQFTELGEGKIDASLRRVRVFDSAKFGIKFEQWVEEDEDATAEPAGDLRLNQIRLIGNESSDEPKLNNIVVR